VVLCRALLCGAIFALFEIEMKVSMFSWTHHDGKGINKQNYPGTSSVLVRTHIHLLLNTAHTALLD
jgi:hypothetical protein